ncbi:MAG: sulfite exporter TauE/SafE family protein [Candidatus Hadarchaeota archaeon]
MIELSLLLIGLLIATVSSMVGLAGGSFMVPMLVLVFGLSTQKAVGASLFAIMFLSISATLAYARQKKIHYKVGLMLDTLDIPGAVLGAFITTLVSSTLLAGMFGALLLSIVIYMFLIKNSKTEGSSDRKYCRMSTRILTYCLLGSLMSGVVSGLFGIGGGVIDEMVLILMLGMSIHLSAGTAMFGMAITTVAAVVPHWFLGNIALGYAVPLATGCVVGGQIGPYISKRTRASTLRKILATIFIVIGVRMLLVPFVGV